MRDEGGPSFCANKVWYIHFAPRLNELAGERARSDDPLLRSDEAYELSYQKLYRSLPNCRSCVCEPWE